MKENGYEGEPKDLEDWCESKLWASSLPETPAGCTQTSTPDPKVEEYPEEQEEPKDPEEPGPPGKVNRTEEELEENL